MSSVMIEPGDAAVRLHGVAGGCADPHLLEAVRERAQVARGHRLDVRVEHDRRRSLVLPPLAGHLV
jgi:hypothetical protein